MSILGLSRARRAILGGLLAAVTSTILGCTGDGSGTAPPVPSQPDETASLKKSGRAPRVPRGPDMAKALQDGAQGK